MAKGEALGYTVNMEPWCRHHILCTHDYLLYQSTQTVNVRRKITALTDHSENKLDSSILHPAIYNTHWSYIHRGNHNSIASIVIKIQVGQSGI